MSSVEIGLIGIVLIVIIILIGVPVAFTLILVGVAGLVVLTGGIGPAFGTLVLTTFQEMSRYTFAVLPLFLLMGAFVSRSDIGKEAFDMGRAWVGQIRGGLAMATTIGAGLFAACCGSSMASAVAMGKVAYPEMKRLKYATTLAVGTIAAGGTMGILIPPSTGFIIIGILTELSIGKLFLAGIVPGILMVLFYIVTIYIICLINPSLGPASPKTSIGQKFGSLKLTWPILLLFLLVIGGIYGGIFTPTEAAGVGAFGALIISLVRRQLTKTDITECLMETVKLSAMLMVLIIGGFVFNKFLALSRIPFIASEFIVSLEVNRYIILLMVIVLYLLLGMLLDIFGILVLTIPIIFPIMMALGFDPIWYSVIMVRLVEIGMVTPPFGINIFALAGVVDVPIGTMYRGVVPFVIADLAHVAMLILIPSISTFLADLMMTAR